MAQEIRITMNSPEINSKIVNTLRPRKNGRHFPDDIFKCIFFNENVWISIKSSLKFVPKVLVNNIPALVLTMAWRRPGDKPLSEPMLASLLTHICVTRPQWFKHHIVPLTYWDRDKMGATLQAFSNEFFMNENFWIFNTISLKKMPYGPTGDDPTLVYIMAWCRTGTGHYMNQWWHYVLTHTLELNGLYATGEK